ncbi:hypothetical protein LR48_Vigan04g017800 [Vigna angularis]|uniref:Auxin-induced protein n=1 Tax=Phaseolus angularis TaxID=3914 RepID=A0A0L9UAP8_PHAAN|nr:hypothetical protein LR48_Vigan04g017800 [Vigna angularis]
MDSGVGYKLTGIRQIVRLKEMLQKWQNVTLGQKASIPTITDKVPNNDGSGLPLINKRGYLAVYVGPELRRFIIPTTYLSHSLFKVLLEKAADEFGFDHSGGLTIPCETETFKYLLKCIENENKDQLNHKTAQAAESSGTVEEFEKS